MSRRTRVLLHLLTALISFFVLAMLAASLWRSTLLLTAIYLIASIAVLARWHRVDDLAYFVTPFVAGPCGELLAVQSGAWRYAGAGLGIPVWLPFAWGLAGICMKQTSLAAVSLLCQGQASARPPRTRSPTWPWRRRPRVRRGPRTSG